MQLKEIWPEDFQRSDIPDRISQLALARELGVPDDEVSAHPWPAWLPSLGTPTCAQQIATLRTVLEQVQEVLRVGDIVTASALVEQGLTVPVDEMVVDTARLRSSAVRSAMTRGGRRVAGTPRPATRRCS